VLAAVVFLVGVTGLRIYLDWITGTGYTYGALAAPIAFLLATFFIALAIIIGAHVNAAIQAEWPAVLRRRGRVMARMVPVGTPASAPLGLTTAIERDPDAAAALLERLGYDVSRREPDAAHRAAQEAPTPLEASTAEEAPPGKEAPTADGEPTPEGSPPGEGSPPDPDEPAGGAGASAGNGAGEQPPAQDHAPPDMAADRAR
jgi:membrane protein